jgi:hypothetical protein
VDVRMRFVRMQNHRIAVLERELIVRELPYRFEQFVRRCPGRHGEDDVVNELGWPASSPDRARVLPFVSQEIQIPVLDDHLLQAPAPKTLTVIHLNIQRTLPAYVS